MNNVVNLQTVSLYDVLAAMFELQTGKAVGPDGISKHLHLGLYNCLYCVLKDV